MDRFGVGEWVPYGVPVLLGLLGLTCAIHALMHKRDPRAAIGWIALCLFAPLFGAISYLLLGVNRAERKAQQLGVNSSKATSEAFGHFGDGVVRAPPSPTSGNKIAPMFDAGHAYSTMLAAINSANHSVLLSQYIFESRGIGWQFIDALGNAARRGVEVHVILDKVGALYSIGSTRRQLQRVGVRVAMFLPAKLRVFGWRFNLRNHRKILVVDDQLAFTGGMNIRNGYLRKRPRKAPDIRDTHFRCEGPVANDLAAIFRDDWRYATGEILPAFAEPRETDGNVNCRTTIDGPDNNVDLLTITLLAAIATAQQRVRITMPYFLPPRELMSGLQAAAIRGVRVDVLIPQNNNLRVVDWAMQHTFRELLRYGIGVYKQVGPFDHSKLITIDNDRCVFGSVNIDHRSLRLNFELAIEAWNPHLTATLNEYIERQIETADILDLESTQRQPRWMKLRNAIAWLGSPYL